MTTCDICKDLGLLRVEVPSIDGIAPARATWSKCVCKRKEAIQAKLDTYGTVKYKNPKSLLKYANEMFIQGVIADFKNLLAGYMLATGEITEVITVQFLFNNNFEPLETQVNLTLPDVLVIDFAGLIMNKLLPLHIIRIFEQRSRHPSKKTWILSHLTSGEMFNRFSSKDDRDSQDAYYAMKEYISKLPVKKLKSSVTENPSDRATDLYGMFSK